MKTRWILVMIALGAVACTSSSGSGSEAAGDGGQALTGTIVLTGDWNSIATTEPDGTVVTIANSHYQSARGDWCAGAGGYDDLDEGTQVRVTDGGGEILALGALEAGELTDFLGPYREKGWECTFTFEVAEIPDADFYQVEVSHRGELAYTPEELEAAGWNVDLTLGS